LIPLSLAPSQWDPLIATLSARYCTISLGGPLLGVVGVLEERGHSNYLTIVKGLLDLVDIRPNEVVLEVGGGSGVIIREIVRRTAGANPIIDVDISPYLLREAEALTKQAGLADRISFQAGNAEAIPLDDDSVDVALSFTVMEEGDADRMLSELVRVNTAGRTHCRHGAFPRYAVVDKCSAHPSSPRQGGRTRKGGRRPGRLRGREFISAVSSGGARRVNLLFAMGVRRRVPCFSDRCFEADDSGKPSRRGKRRVGIRDRPGRS
jgi:SAM-dependent methyltransferase